nr:laforin-like [Camelus dromedarius]
MGEQGDAVTAPPAAAATPPETPATWRRRRGGSGACALRAGPYARSAAARHGPGCGGGGRGARILVFRGRGARSGGSRLRHDGPAAAAARATCSVGAAERVRNDAAPARSLSRSLPPCAPGRGSARGAGGGGRSRGGAGGRGRGGGTRRKIPRRLPPGGSAARGAAAQAPGREREGPPPGLAWPGPARPLAGAPPGGFARWTSRSRGVAWAPALWLRREPKLRRLPGTCAFPEEQLTVTNALGARASFFSPAGIAASFPGLRHPNTMLGSLPDARLGSRFRPFFLPPLAFPPCLSLAWPDSLPALSS